MKRNKNAHRHKNFYFKNHLHYLGLFFISFIVLIPIASLILPDTKFSFQENRVLTQNPRFSMDSLFEGRYTKKVDQYVSDQLLLRNSWIHLKTATDRLMGKNKSNGVYLGKDKSLIEEFLPQDKQETQETLAAINKFYENHSSVRQYFMLVPTAISINKDELPNNAPVFNQEEAIQSFEAQLNKEIKILDPTAILEENKDQALYYKTDHHWTSLAAFLSFKGIASEMGIQPNEEGYSVYPVSKDFLGTLASKSGYFLNQKDIIEVYLPKSDLDYSVVTYAEEQKKSPSLYASEKLEGKDKYTVFLDGNHPLVRIENPVNNDRNLLIFKDSYANAFVPFLTAYFSEITLVDPRYYYGNIDTLIASSRITDVLYLYNANTFFGDSNLPLVLNNE